jgi:pyruvate/2-oxoglutarate dehydrogenase complex dihydrolipoamide acyltransferase (E2) component
MGMPIEIRAPEVAKSEMKPSVTRWLKSIGDAVTMGEPLLEIVTNNGTVEIKAPATGVLSEVCFRDGQFIQAHSVLGMITEY